MHLGNAAVRDCRPQRQAVFLTMLFGYFERLDRLVKAVHLGQYISAVQADRGERRMSQCVVGIFEQLLSPIVMAQRFGIPVEPVIDVTQRYLQCGEIRHILRFFKRGARALGEIERFAVPA